VSCIVECLHNCCKNRRMTVLYEEFFLCHSWSTVDSNCIISYWIVCFSIVDMSVILMLALRLAVFVLCGCHRNTRIGMVSRKGTTYFTWSLCGVIFNDDFIASIWLAWLGSRVVSVLDSGTEEPGFKSQLRRCQVTVLGKLFTPIVPLFTKQQNR